MWIEVPGSPYGGQAFCESFPRTFLVNSTDNDASWPAHLAQVGKADLPRANFNNIFNSMITIFQVHAYAPY
jgi:hypothetical protein